MYTYRLIPGYSSTDHLASEAIARAAGPHPTRRAAESALRRAWKAVRAVTSGAGAMPRIAVVRVTAR